MGCCNEAQAPAAQMNTKLKLGGQITTPTVKKAYVERVKATVVSLLKERK
jgi:hypothetical protein